MGLERRGRGGRCDGLVWPLHVDMLSHRNKMACLNTIGKDNGEMARPTVVALLQAARPRAEVLPRCLFGPSNPDSAVVVQVPEGRTAMARQNKRAFPANVLCCWRRVRLLESRSELHGSISM